MKKILIAILLCGFAYSASAEQEDNGQPLNVDSVTILASSSLTVPISEITKKYSSEQNIDVNTVYDSSAELMRKIADGDPADIVIIASEKYLGKLKQEGLVVQDSIKPLAKNRLVIVASKQMNLVAGKTTKETLDAIYKKAIMIIADTENTSLGEYTKQALQNMGVWQNFEKRVMLAPTSSKTIDLIIKGQNCGIVYKSDAELYADKVNMISEIPDKSYKPVIYSGALVVSGNLDKAKKLLNYLADEKAQKIFKENGFTVNK